MKFIRDTIEPASGSISLPALYLNYVQWCKMAPRGFTPVTRTTFGRALRPLGYSLGVRKIDGKSVRCVTNARYKSETRTGKSCPTCGQPL